MQLEKQFRGGAPVRPRMTPTKLVIGRDGLFNPQGFFKVLHPNFRVS